MFIKYLTITSKKGTIREIEFKAGLNLIIDSTSTTEGKLTGNNVGKTTVLKLIDICLGGDSSIIYKDTEDKKSIYDSVKKYLINEKILISITLVDDLNNLNSREIVIKRNFLSGQETILSINEKPIIKKDFEDELLNLLIPNQKEAKPTFRQIISHNIRYKDLNINNTTRTLDKYSSDDEYETLYLFLLGCAGADGTKKQDLLRKSKQEETFKKRLENNGSKTKYEAALSVIENDIIILDKKKSSFNLNKNFEQDLETLNSIKYKISKTSSIISKMRIRKELIDEATKELKNSKSSIDLKQLEILYKEATLNISGIQKTFSDLVAYHNNMLIEKAKFITEELPSLIDRIQNEERTMFALRKEEKAFSNKIAMGDSFAELEKIIIELNEKYRNKGEYEIVISQLNEIDNNIDELNKEMQTINKQLFSKDFEDRLKSQIDKFNKYFSAISQELYGEHYTLFSEIKPSNKNSNQKIYKFSAFNTNMSSGKKQGEILCFDLAYILFADDEQIPCLHFLLNDKKELMHDNQLIKVAEFLEDKNIQVVISILKDKLPDKVLKNAHLAIELSQDSKLFKIEENELNK